MLTDIPITSLFLAQTFWHQKIVRILKEICSEEYPITKDGNIDPVVLARKGTRLTCEYRPDIIADHEFPAARDVYEVVDSESVSEAVADVIQFLVMPGHCRLRLICADNGKVKKIADSLRVILYNLGRENDFERITIDHVAKRQRGLRSLRRRLRRIIHSTMTKR